MMNEDKITVEELLEEIWQVEHVRVDVHFKGKGTRLVDHYPYTTPIDGDCTVDDLMIQRIYPLLDNAISANQTFFINPNSYKGE